MRRPAARLADRGAARAREGGSARARSAVVLARQPALSGASRKAVEVSSAPPVTPSSRSPLRWPRSTSRRSGRRGREGCTSGDHPRPRPLGPCAPRGHSDPREERPTGGARYGRILEVDPADAGALGEMGGLRMRRAMRRSDRVLEKAVPASPPTARPCSTWRALWPPPADRGGAALLRADARRRTPLQHGAQQLGLPRLASRPRRRGGGARESLRLVRADRRRAEPAEIARTPRADPAAQYGHDQTAAPLGARARREGFTGAAPPQTPMWPCTDAARLLRLPIDPTRSQRWIRIQNPEHDEAGTAATPQGSDGTLLRGKAGGIRRARR